ncbi:Uncharacterized protein APZ42_025700 [Daphnia magna]|uniref:Uncharacterized protein n=1 Tax=Daphnia magna TaxID=35525 RepID=A0A164SSL9_9CRUS|nr:Uncharacterized protein APZ42_025700 [Daphnia magna]
MSPTGDVVVIHLCLLPKIFFVSEEKRKKKKNETRKRRPDRRLFQI